MKKSAIAVALPIGLLLTGCVASTPEPAATPSAPAPVEVRYEVDFEAAHKGLTSKTPSADITVSTPTGTVQKTVDLPMKTKDGQIGVRGDAPAGSPLYISAQKNDAYGSITCRIYSSGELISENTSSGDYSIATCKGTAR